MYSRGTENQFLRYIWLFLGFLLFCGCKSEAGSDFNIYIFNEEEPGRSVPYPDVYLHNSHKNNNDFYLLELKNFRAGLNILEFDNSHTDKLFIYALEDGKKRLISETGDLVPYIDRLVLHRNILIPLDNQDSIVVNVVNRGAYLIPLHLKENIEFLQFDFIRNSWLGACLGIILVFLLVALAALIFSNADKMILYYLFFGLFSFLFFLTEFGYGDIYFWPKTPGYEEPMIFLFIICSMISLLLLVFKVFHLDEGESYWLRIQKTLLGVCALFLVAILLGMIQNDWLFERFYDGLLLLVVIVFLFTVIAGIQAQRRNVSYASYFLAAMSIMIVGSLLKPLSLVGLVEFNGFVQYGGVTGLMINLIALAGLFTVRFFDGVNYSVRLENQIIHLERSALQAQMNPHFIFNSLNSIQNYIAKNDQMKAMEYLSGFAKLIRRILNASSEKQITVEQEISMLEGYLSLEKLRFKEKFDFNLVIPKELDVQKVHIPPLLIQPFVENAVIHGLKNKEGKGFINVKFEMKPPFLKIIIEDNGVGIGSGSTSNHKSKGMSITQKRLAHLNKSKDELAIRIENKKDLGRSESGTIVTLMINTH